MLVAVTLGLLVARMVIRPVTSVRDGLIAMAAGDLTARVTVSSRDEVGQMAEALNEAGDSLRTAIAATAESRRPSPPRRRNSPGPRRRSPGRTRRPPRRPA